MLLPYLLLVLGSVAIPAWAADTKLYLKEGGFHKVREFEIKPDRVRYFSTERGDWEEIPLDLVDLKKTQRELKQRESDEAEIKKIETAERTAERGQRKEISLIPAEPGVYWIDGGNLMALQAADVKVVTDKRRSILKAITPVPMVAGKSTLEMDGRNSKFTIARQSPELYLRLSQSQQFTIVRCAWGKEGTRIVERWSIVPISKELIQERDEVPVFRYQVGEDLYKIWPQKPMLPGEYAFLQYTEGKPDVQVWDFAVRGEAPQP
jgi:hypothetical protein